MEIGRFYVSQFIFILRNILLTCYLLWNKYRPITSKVEFYNFKDFLQARFQLSIVCVQENITKLHGGVERLLNEREVLRFVYKQTNKNWSFCRFYSRVAHSLLVFVLWIIQASAYKSNMVLELKIVQSVLRWEDRWMSWRQTRTIGESCHLFHLNSNSIYFTILPNSLFISVWLNLYLRLAWQFNIIWNKNKSN